LRHSVRKGARGFLLDLHLTYKCKFGILVAMIRETFGHYLYELRKNRSLTQKDLAKTTRIEVTYLSKLESNRSVQPKEETIESISKALGLNEAERLKLYSLAKRLPPELEDLAVKPLGLEVLRAARDLSDSQLREMLEDIKRRKK